MAVQATERGGEGREEGHTKKSPPHARKSESKEKSPLIDRPPVLAVA